MKPNPDAHRIAAFLEKNMDLILKEYDKKVAATKQKHFIAIHCKTAKDIGIAYNFYIERLDSPSVSKLNLAAQETVLNTKLNNDICLIIANEKNELTVMNYKR